MSAECIPMSALPHITRLYGEYLDMAARGEHAPLRSWYGAVPTSNGWMGRDVAVAKPGLLADLLQQQNESFGAGPAAQANIERLRNGARAVVTGQQVGLLGGPLLTLLKAATAIARATEASRATGVEHVPIFWLASEDHDLAEVDQVSMPSRRELETLHLGPAGTGGEVGSVRLGAGIAEVLEQAAGLLAYAPVCDLLARCYQPEATLSEAFGRLIAALFADHGLIVIDAAGRGFHALGASTLLAAIEHAAELEGALLERTAALQAAGYHAQVLVNPGASLLFLLDVEIGRRQPLRRIGETWKAGARSYTTVDLLAILEDTPERLSPNALLRPVFQDTLLPTAAYVGGPAEVAYFAQSAVLYDRILDRVTPVLPRFSATLVEPAIASILSRHEVSLDQILEVRSTEVLTQRLGARAMPIEGKRRLAAVGNAMDLELTALTEYLSAMDLSLGASAGVSASKMRYQMDRLRRMAAAFEVQKEASLRKHAEAMMLHLFPNGHPQERVLAGIWFVAQRVDLIDLLVAEAGSMCVGHTMLPL